MPERIDRVNDPDRELNAIERSLLEAEIIEAIRTVFDPELPVNVYDLGLIYAVDVADDASVVIKMTLTSPAWPVAESLPLGVEQRASEVSGVKEARVGLVWEPPFTIDRIPEHIRLELGLL